MKGNRVTHTEAVGLRGLETRLASWGEARVRWGVSLACVLALSCSYLAVAHLAARRGVTVWDPSLPWDRTLPALPWSIWAYLTNILYYPACILLLPPGPQATRALFRLWGTLLTVCAISLTVFHFCPAEVTMRDQVLAALGDDSPMLSRVYATLYEVDPPFNAWPSGHISQTLVMALFLSHVWAKNRGRRALLWALWTVMAISVLLTKQHLLFDLLTGVCLGAVAWRRWLRPYLPTADAELPEATHARREPAL